MASKATLLYCINSDSRICQNENALDDNDNKMF